MPTANLGQCDRPICNRDVERTGKSGCIENCIYVTSFLVFHTKVTVNIDLKDVVRMVTSIPSMRCLCYYWRRLCNHCQMNAGTMLPDWNMDIEQDVFFFFELM